MSDFEYDAVEVENEGIFELWDVDDDVEESDVEESEYIPIEVVSDSDSDNEVESASVPNVKISNMQHDSGISVNAGENASMMPNVSNSNGQNGAGNVNGPGEERTYRIVNRSRHYFERFRITGEQMTIQFNDPSNNEDLITWMRRCFDDLLYQLITRRLKSGEMNISDRVSISFNSADGFEPIHVSFRCPDQIDTDVILERISIVANSNKEFFLNETLNIHFDHIRMPQGGGGTLRLRGVSFEEYASRKYGYISYATPKNSQENDFSCLAYTLVLSIAHVNKNKNELRTLKRNFDKLRASALELCAWVNVDLDANRGGGLEELEKFQDYLQSEYRITVYGDRYGSSVLFEKSKDPTLKKIKLLLYNNHFYAITSCTAAFACNYYCEECHKASSNKLKHKCPYRCSLCFNETKCPEVPYHKRLSCNDCNRRFHGPKCFQYHLENVCAKFKVCNKCDRFYVQTAHSDHKCDFHFCRTCLDYKKFGHECYMPTYSTKRDYDEVEDDDINDDDDEETKKKKKRSNPPLFIFFDLETVQNHEVPGSLNQFEHEPNLCVANNVCKYCIDLPDDIDISCHKCGDRVHIFEGLNCVLEFMQYVTRSASFDKFKNVIVIAHNMGMFDGHFLLKHIYSHGGYGEPHLIMNGTKILLMTLGKYKFLDSLNYFGKPLSELPAMFNLPEQKGYYGHLFNTMENYNYIGEIPDIKYFSPDTKSVEERRKLLEWHEKQVKSGVVYDNRLELIKYCKRDVEILRKACTEFRRTFWSENKIDPFIDASTIASACNKVFRANYLSDTTIGIIPNGGYRFKDNQSEIALKWLCWLEIDKEIKIEHAGNGHEALLPGIGAVDGYHADSNTVYEFLGDYWHGCEKCYPVQNEGDAKDDGTHYENQMFVRREKTERKLTKIKDAGYNLIVMRECEFKKELKSRPEIEIILWGHPIMSKKPLDPRDAFMGGRTNANKLHYKVKKGEKIKYIDICSLYPYINKTFKCPVAHPVIHIGDEDCKKLDINTVEGLIKCTVAAPRKLQFPVLPANMHNKLMFFLCRSCAIQQKCEACQHYEDERTFNGTWVADELREALKNGYKILEFDEVWEYNVAQYDPVTKTGGVFAAYINNFIRIKTEASGWPKWCKSEEQKVEYLKEFECREGIALRRDRIVKNKGLRALAKMMCNSFWGKFGQSSNKSKTLVISQPATLFSMLTNPDIIVESVRPINDELIVINYSSTAEAVKSLNHVNVVVAAYTTAGARLELYKYLKALGDRVLYYDTDSIIYIEREGEWSPPTGPYLGDMTDELEEYGPGSYIIRFVSAGPKNYAFIVYSPLAEKEEDKYSIVCKVKGISLNYKNSKLINFEAIKEIICKTNDRVITIEDDKILRTSSNLVYSTKRKKTYRLCYTKRMRLGDGENTCAWGY